jgi:hypothetical protein
MVAVKASVLVVAWAAVRSKKDILMVKVRCDGCESLIAWNTYGTWMK